VTEHPDRDQQERAAQAILARALRAVFGTQMPGDVVAAAIEGVPERVLVTEVRAADLLVLGSTPAPPRCGGSVGPVIRGCLSLAQCPVMVIGQCEANSKASTTGPSSSAVRRHRVLEGSLAHAR
jgi:nucleotide-binding universal stress UspA family protein